MKKLLFIFLVLCSVVLLTGCFAVFRSNIGMKILEDKCEVDVAILSSATAFYQNEQFIYCKTPVQTCREKYPAVSGVILEGHMDDKIRYYPLSPIHKDSVFLRREKKRGNLWYNWEVVKRLPESAKPIPQPDDWFDTFTQQGYWQRRELTTVAAKNKNSTWRTAGAITCIILLDVPLSVAYTFSGGILAIPAALTTRDSK